MLLFFNSYEEWLAARREDITSTEVAALFGLDPRKSRRRLWHEKRGDIEPDFVDSEPAKWGRRLQSAIGQYICEDEGWQDPQDLTGYYYRHDDRRLGCSLDFECLDQEERIILEVKQSGRVSKEEGWGPNRAPLRYEFQIMTQMHLAIREGNADSGAIGTLVGGNRTLVFRRKYDREVGAMIDSEVDSFWRSIETNTPPDPDFLVDAPILERLQGSLLELGDVLDLSRNNRAVYLMESIAELKAALKPLAEQAEDIQDRMKAAQAEIHSMMGAHENAIIGDYQVTARKQEVAGKYVHPYSWRRFDFKTRKKGR
jgi:putative phage-type endonuclease